MDQKDPIVVKRAAPLLKKIRELSLRGGDGGLRDLCRVFRKERIGPEEFKAEMFNFGIALTGPESTAIFQAFSDAIGYLLLTPFLEGILADALGPESSAAVDDVLASLSPTIVQLTAQQRKAGFTKPRRVVALSKMLGQVTFGDDLLVAVGGRTDSAAQREFFSVFDDKYYPEDTVVDVELRAYYAALVSLIGDRLDDATIAKHIRHQWGVTGHSEASSPTKTRKVLSSSAPGELSHVLCQTVVAEAMPYKQKFVEKRDKIDVPSRIVGYQGHIPFAAERFGETFHRTEAAVPPLHKDDADSLGKTEKPPVPIDPSYGFVRQGNKANQHNFRFA